MRTIGAQTTFLGIVISTIPKEPVAWAWMDAGLIDVQSQVCAVAIANDATEAAAVNRRDKEFVSPFRQAQRQLVRMALGLRLVSRASPLTRQPGKRWFA